jgi:hypothetical protein
MSTRVSFQARNTTQIAELMVDIRLLNLPRTSLSTYLESHSDHKNRYAHDHDIDSVNT